MLRRLRGKQTTITLRHIDGEAGFTPMTDCNVIHKNYARVSPATIEKVRAEFQASAIMKLIEEGQLSEKEQEVFRNGRNACGVSAPKHSTVGEYRAATGLECLFGYLHLAGNDERCRELLELIW